MTGRWAMLMSGIKNATYFIEAILQQLHSDVARVSIGDSARGVGQFSSGPPQQGVPEGGGGSKSFWGLGTFLISPFPSEHFKYTAVG